jgi:hypothetical protein
MSSMELLEHIKGHKEESDSFLLVLGCQHLRRFGILVSEKK